MAFDPKTLLKSPALATAGGVVVGLGVFTFIQATFDYMIRPVFHWIFGNAVLTLSERNNIGLGCGGIILAFCVLVIAVAAGFGLAKLGSRE